MKWTCLGHACWLVEAAGLRLLCDPLLESSHYGGVFEVDPPRRLRAEALRPDFVLVSHAHPDHFDLDSLARLARLDPESVLVTPDPLVAWSARELGFRTVHELAAGQRVSLDGVELITTPSVAPDEWGVVIASEEGVGWNAVDSVLGGAAALEQVLAEVERACRRPLDLALVRWQPLLEIACPLAEAQGFPYAEYRELLREHAALPRSTTLVPSAAGTRHAGAAAWLNRFVYPLTRARFLRDLAALRPGSPALPADPGDVLELRGGVVTRAAGAARELVELEPRREPSCFDPFAAPGLQDPRPLAAAERERLRAWLDEELPAVLASEAPQLAPEPLVLSVEVVLAEGERWQRTYRGAEVRAGLDPEWEGLNRVVGSALLDVLEARRDWGQLLLGGELQATSRAYRVDPRGARRLPLAPVFLYYALSYEEAFARYVRRRVGALRDGAAEPARSS